MSGETEAQLSASLQVAQMVGGSAAPPQTPVAPQVSVAFPSVNSVGQQQQQQQQQQPEVNNMLHQHGTQQLDQLKRHEDEIHRVKQFLEQQMSLQHNEIESTKARHQHELQQVAAANQEDNRRCLQANLANQNRENEIRKLETMHNERISNLKNKQGEEISRLQSQLMSFMTIQEEELNRVRQLHLQQQANQRQDQQRELDSLKQLLADKMNHQDQQIAVAQNAVQRHQLAQSEELHRIGNGLASQQKELSKYQQQSMNRDDQISRFRQTMAADKNATEAEIKRLREAQATEFQNLHAKTANEIKQLQQTQQASLTETRDIMNIRDTEVANIQRQQAEQLQHFQNDLAQRKRDNNNELRNLQVLQNAKNEELQRSLQQLMSRQQEQSMFQHSANEEFTKKTALQEQEIHRIREKTEEDFASRLRLQQMHTQEMEITGKLMSQEKQMSAVVSQFEREIASKEQEIQYIKEDLTKREIELKMRSEELKHRDQLLTERDRVTVPQLQEKLMTKERELCHIQAQYNTTKIDLAAVVQELRGNLATEYRKSQQMQDEITNLTSKLGERSSKCAALESDLTHEKARAQEATQQCEAMLPEINHWKKATEANSTTHSMLREQIRTCQEISDREVRSRDDTIITLRQETDELRIAVAHLSEELANTQRINKQAQAKELEQAQRLNELKNRVKESETELTFTNQALETLQNRNQELERLHMNSVVAALDARYFSDDKNRPQDPLPSVSLEHSALERQQPFSPNSFQTPHTPSDTLYEPVVNSLAKYLSKGT
eukprot:TRINITY_DN1251_c9_g1_i1.p1 TRINITY_DN1251_c9_g1~~TRINITY_DN1251_c9_g1_i1.p1  ORF type:complete len:864 (+),score=222.91 TRINITY_DN1251_c9_g1_i1:247-2592(+)